MIKLVGMEVVETPRLRKTGENTLVYVKICSEKLISEIFYSRMLHQLEKSYQ